MPYYYPIRFFDDKVTSIRTAERLLLLRQKLKTEIREETRENSLLLATWNIRDFDKNRFGYGKRLQESMHYIAEIISTFDIVAMQEVNSDLTGLGKLMDLLGREWDYIVTDTTAGRSGNSERMAFLYRPGKVTFRKIAGEIVLPHGQKISVEDDGGDELQFARTPFLVAFQAGWFKFNLCTVHIYFGSDSGERFERRTEEIDQIAEFFEKRQKKVEENFILLGDFNIKNPSDVTMKALERHNFTIPENLKREKTNLKRDKHYDQIAFQVEDNRLEIGASGVFGFDDIIFRKEDEEIYKDLKPDNKSYKSWRTWQISDHLPMWVELKVDFTDDYLKKIIKEASPS